jgi:hypothetical protein
MKRMASSIALQLKPFIIRSLITQYNHEVSMNSLESRTQTQAATIEQFASLLNKIDLEQLDHLSYILGMIGECYTNKNVHAAFLISNDLDQSNSLVAINANQIQITELIKFMSDAVNESQGVQNSSYVN